MPNAATHRRLALDLREDSGLAVRWPPSGREALRRRIASTRFVEYARRGSDVFAAPRGPYEQ